MGLAICAVGTEEVSHFNYSGIQEARKHLLEKARELLGPEVWENNVKFSWMLDDDSRTPIYDVIDDRHLNPWWNGKLAEMPMWLPGLLAFVDKSDTDPTWSWGEADEIAEMLLHLKPDPRIVELKVGFIFKHAAINRVPAYGR